MDEMMPQWVEQEQMTIPSYGLRARREERLREQMEAEGVNLTPLERLFDRMTAARITHYNPEAQPQERHDVICFCCGSLYRPDDVLDAENIFLCGSCILTRKEKQE